ncbi:LysR family transcriptional regulator [Pseudomonas sp.]|uniref:LysR family transcriptional regulator n=1 Tax=Pseudomonas sp. TaxID=306 RepID=UPI00272B4BB0|nr:LysR family transcriptional regulator [Pseudomonas sp.]
MPDFRQLKHFVALVTHGNYARAAVALHLSQPALSRSIQTLESSLGCTLVNRHSRRISLTAQGEMVLEHARRLLAASHALVEAVKQVDNLEAGILRIGAGPFPAAALVPRAMGELIDAYPALQVEVTVDSYTALRQHLKDEIIELFVSDVRELHNDPDIDITPLPVQRVIAVCRPGHPLLHASKVDFRHAAAYPLAGTHLPEIVARGIRRDTGRDQALSIQCDNFAFLLGLVQYSDALLMAPSDALMQATVSGQVVELPSLSAVITQHSAYGLVSRKGHGLSPAAQAFIARIHTEPETQSAFGPV